MSDTPATEVKPPTPARPPGKHKRRGISKKAKNLFADGIIVLCLAMCVYITVVTVGDYHRLDKVMPAAVIMALFGMWGGELLIIALRQVLGSDVVAKSKGYQTSSSLSGYSDIYSDTTTDETNLSV